MAMVVRWPLFNVARLKAERLFKKFAESSSSIRFSAFARREDPRIEHSFSDDTVSQQTNGLLLINRRSLIIGLLQGLKMSLRKTKLFQVAFTCSMLFVLMIAGPARAVDEDNTCLDSTTTYASCVACCTKYPPGTIELQLPWIGPTQESCADDCYVHHNQGCVDTSVTAPDPRASCLECCIGQVSEEIYRLCVSNCDLNFPEPTPTPTPTVGTGTPVPTPAPTTAPCAFPIEQTRVEGQPCPAGTTEFAVGTDCPNQGLPQFFDYKCYRCPSGSPNQCITGGTCHAVSETTTFIRTRPDGSKYSCQTKSVKCKC